MATIVVEANVAGNENNTEFGDLQAALDYVETLKNNSEDARSYQIMLASATGYTLLLSWTRPGEPAPSPKTTPPGIVTGAG